MRFYFLHILLTLTSLITGEPALAQVATAGVYVPVDGQIYFHPGDTIAIFGDIRNEGKMGSLRNANILFLGQHFRLDGANAQLTVRTGSGIGIDGEGGNFIFQQPHPITGTSHIQTIQGNYNAATNSGSSFPNLTINNSNGVWLDSSSTKVRETLTFLQGKLILNDQNLVIGHHNSGDIQGYNHNRYVVTGTGRYGGYLIRETVSGGASPLVYPIGADAANYSPLAFTAQRNAHMVGGRVSNTVLRMLDAGADLRDSTTGTVWELVQRDSIPLTLQLQLQHELRTEGQQFAAARNQSFISLFGNGSWNRQGIRATPVSPGTLTTGIALTGAGMNTALLSVPAGGASVWMAKFAFAPPAGPAPGPDTGSTIITLRGRRINEKEVFTEFVTTREYRNVVMYLQRRFAGMATFTTLGPVSSQAPNGTSNIPLNYSKTDPDNTFNGITYYRIVAQNTSGQFTVSNEIAIAGMQAAPNYIVNVWPNPTQGRYWIGINGDIKVKYFNVYLSNGQLIRRVPVNNRSVIEQYDGIQGSYFIGFFGEDDKLLLTRQLIIRN